MEPNADETRNTEQGAPPAAGQPSEGSPGSTSNSPRTFTEEAAKKMVSDALAEQGRKHKEALKSLEERLKTIEAEKETRILEELNDKPDQLSAFQLRKKLKELEEFAKNKDEELGRVRSELENERKLTAGSKRSQLIAETVQGYEGIDAAKLTALCDRLNLTTQEQIAAAAETLGTKKGNGGENHLPPIQADSGVTRGGAEDLSKLSPIELGRRGYSRK
jgi:hypothetical protein